MEQTGLRVDSDANHSTRLLFIITYKNLQRAITSYLIVPFYPLLELLEISWQKVFLSTSWKILRISDLRLDNRCETWAAGRYRSLSPDASKMIYLSLVQEEISFTIHASQGRVQWKEPINTCCQQWCDLTKVRIWAADLSFKRKLNPRNRWT